MRGVLCKKGSEVSPLANGGRPWRERERERGINGEGCGVLDILERYFGRRYFENLLEGKEGKKKEKK